MAKFAKSASPRFKSIGGMKHFLLSISFILMVLLGIAYLKIVGKTEFVATLIKYGFIGSFLIFITSLIATFSHTIQIKKRRKK